MANSKLVIKMSYSNTNNELGGWSEVFYTQQNMDDTLTLGRTYLQARMLLSTGAVAVQSIEAFDLDRPGVSTKSAFTLPAGGTFAPGPKSATDVPQMAVKFKVYSSSRNRRQVIIPGIPDAAVQGGKFVGTTTVFTGLNRTRAFLRGGNFCIRGVDKSQVPQELVGISTTGLITTVLDQSWAIGDKIQLYRVTDVDRNAVRGIFPIASTTDAKHFQLGRYGTKGLVQGGKARKYVLSMQPITAATTGEVATLRKIGRPFSPYVGRRRRAS